ncbi:hypothetical protein J8281_18490 [Aquimarina sp. U1-2]|uniref:hypothetical protein n=1 Tax=Aquimarina sp. U1-2 TaxID=2823141 RepID=UPI001AECA21F|nr:hypothetical protein [Aquimarina sp. U1-2]MBP2834193.1 hypothetical protein [Aquimarina sp. U1-2]
MKENVIGILILILYFSPVLYQLVIVLKEYKAGNRKPFKKLKRFLKVSFLILIPILIIFVILSHTNYLNYESPITYDRIDQITFENFRGIEFFKKSLYGNKRFAYVVTSIESDIDGNEVTVQSYFHPSRSFVYNNHSTSKELLSHELYHFKITELYTRKLKKKLSNLKTNNTAVIEEIISNTRIEERSYQKQYDYDTFHSYVYGEQKKYEKIIDSLLNLLSKFKQPKVIINDES